MNTKRTEKYEPELEAVISSFECDFEVLPEYERLQTALETSSMEYESNPNLEHLENLIRLRFEQSYALGKATPAQVILEKRHFKTSASVLDFLDELQSQPMSAEPKIVSSFAETFQFLRHICTKVLQIDVEIQEQALFCDLPCVKFAISKDDQILGEIFFIPGRISAHYTLQCRILGSQSASVLITAPVKNRGRLSFAESQSIFHEFGHAMHSVLSETKYQTLSGTRGSLEIAEIPSNLFEYFHAQTFGTKFEGIDARDVQLAKFDQILHSTKPGKDGWIKEFLPAALAKITVPHLAAYGASYYVYPLGKHVAAKLANKDGNFLLDKLFKRGGLVELSDIL